ncbi:hypothetical protein BAZ12_19455 [Elizabethkingia miricola]|uniref:hypothetical protein n=1 Tax=Elizabethkingia miricola TaxID=172045 RepID=UPI000708EFFD|nr:hypothetical protein [Elizabethkingia miricola]MCL1653847.1 hypothetical protein [Elizabethkingia miricola]OPC76188.1 hypothetical protein BAZ12_19455 [Elizabethkingia miricola]WQM37637.1 hypothetical protein U2S95_14855 [Elizabethkingia miricola]
MENNNMTRIIHHMCIDIEGLLKNYKRKKINFFQDDNGKFLSDSEARRQIAELQKKGHKLMSCSPSKCIGFDPFGGGCPGHPVSNEKKENDEN